MGFPAEGKEEERRNRGDTVQGDTDQRHFVRSGGAAKLTGDGLDLVNGSSSLHRRVLWK